MGVLIKTDLSKINDKLQPGKIKKSSVTESERHRSRLFESSTLIDDFVWNPIMCNGPSSTHFLPLDSCFAHRKSSFKWSTCALIPTSATIKGKGCV